MTHRTYERNSSGIVFFGVNRSDQTFESNPNFTIGDNYLNAANLSVDGDLYVNNFQFNSGVTINTDSNLFGGDFLPLGSSITIGLSDTSVSSGVYGSASQIPTFTVDSQGRLTEASNIEIDLSASGITGLEDYVNNAIFDSGKFLDSSSVSFTVIDDVSVSADVTPGLSGEILSSDGNEVLWIENPSGNLQSQITQNAYDITVVSGIASSGFVLPTGGLEGQILYKVTDNSDELAWIDNYATEVREIVKNDTGSGLLKGTVVMATGAVGDRIQVAPAVADGSIEARYMFGVTSEDIDNGQEGYVTLVGPLKGISTIGLPLGTVLWIDPDNPGELTSTQPSSPNLQMSVAIVTNGNANNGRIFVRMWEQQPGLHELHDVNVDVGLVSGDLIGYDSSNGTWRNIENPSGNLQSQITQNADDIAVVSGLLGSYVPYSGATQDVDLGSNKLSTQQVVISGGVITSSTPVINATQTWNDGATAFTGALLNVADTASASDSLLMDLQVDGSSKFKIKKTGTVISSNIYSVPKSNQKGYLFGEDANWGLMYTFNSWLNLQVTNNVGYRFYSDGNIVAYAKNITIKPGASSIAQSAILTGNDVNVVDQIAGQAIVKGGDKTNNNGSGGYVSIYGGSSYGQDIPSSGDVTISAGRSTGSGLGASIILRTSPPGNSGTTINSSMDRVIIDSYGDVGIGESLPDAQLHVVNDTASDVAVIVQAAAAQSANLQEWRNNNSDILSYIGSDGSIHASTGTTIYDYNFVVHSGDSYFRDAVYIGQERDLGGGPNATLNLNSYNNSQIILQNHGQWSKYRIWCSLGSLTFQDVSINTDSGFRFIPRLNGITRFNNGFGLIGSTTSYTDHTAFELRPVNVSDFACYDISFKFRQTYANSTQFEKFLFKKNGDFLASGNGLFSGNITSSGNATIASGVILPDSIPVDTTETLYNNSGILYFDGSPINTDTDTTYTAGSGLTLVDTQFNVYGGSGHFVELNVEGPFTATTKSFLINHPLHTGMKLQYGSLEGPENGVYVRGTTSSKVIDLPDYWRELVDEQSITVTLTPLNEFQPLCVKHKDNRHIIVGGVVGEYDYVVYGERKDVSKLKVEWWA